MATEADLEKYHQLIYYTLTRDPLVFIHQNVVDAFAAQYADENSKRIGVAFALIGLYLYLEKGFTGKEVQNAHVQLAKKRNDWPAFNLPNEKGAITIDNVLAANEGEERDTMIHAWCQSVWDAYHDSHQQVANLVKQELWNSPN